MINQLFKICKILNKKWGYSMTELSSIPLSNAEMPLMKTYTFRLLKPFKFLKKFYDINHFSAMNIHVSFR